MTQATHTPGPWKVSKPTGNYIVAPTGGIAALTYGATKADADLIAAAPDLLAALVRFASAVEVAEALEEIPEGLFPESMADALAAIAKAKGE